MKSKIARALLNEVKQQEDCPVAGVVISFAEILALGPKMKLRNFLNLNSKETTMKMREAKERVREMINGIIALRYELWNYEEKGGDWDTQCIIWSDKLNKHFYGDTWSIAVSELEDYLDIFIYPDEE